MKKGKPNARGGTMADHPKRRTRSLADSDGIIGGLAVCCRALTAEFCACSG
ncbi:MAG: hypothetical protein N2689_09795 [Verrucomicrobiae bacterium]|nr:hypothetical protein [Verrucomicrobiae bacterium]